MAFQAIGPAAVGAVWDVLAEHVCPAGHHEAQVEDAIGLVLAEDVRSLHDFPPFDRAMMDGFAVRAADFADGSATMRNVGLVRAGGDQDCHLEPGTCAQINTGAPIPPGADAVVMVEKSRELGAGRVELTDAPAIGQHVDPAGAVRHVGDLLLRAGSRLGPGAGAALAAGGITHVDVFLRPRVAVLSTGDELVAAGQTLRAGQIHDSNGVALRNLVFAGGAEPVELGRCADNRDALCAALAQGAACDVLCVTGGMSKGTHDLVPELCEELGVEWLVTSLHMKPGKPLRIGRLPSGCWVVGLPGNPVSCMVCFHLFARCIIEGLQGWGVRKPPHLRARLDADLPACGGRPMYQPAEWFAGPDDQPHLLPIPWRGSGDPFGMAAANALLYRPERAAASPCGETVLFVPLDRPG